jgi:hypothetical protein
MQRKIELEGSIVAGVVSLRDIRDMVDFRGRVEDGLNNPTPKDKRRWLELLRTRIDVKDNKAVVTCSLPVEPGVISLYLS